MKFTAFAAAAAALVLGSLTPVAAPAEAQMRTSERTVVRTNGDRTVVRTRTTTVRRHNVRRDRGHHYGWRNQQRRTRVCRTVWRNHHRQQVCTWRYRR